MRTVILGGLLAACLMLPGWRAQAQTAAAPPAPARCSTASVGPLSFVCGVDNPEDVKHIPGTRWLIASGMKDGAGIKLVDTTAKTMIAWHTSAQYRTAPDAKTYPACATPPDPARLQTHGLSLRALPDGRYSLHAVGHGQRESIEVYVIDARPAAPTLTWVGCIPLPAGLAANSVATFSDGQVMATVPNLPGKVGANSLKGIPTGAVFGWRPGGAVFTPVPGMDMPGPNGIETSPDDRQIFVIAFGLRQIWTYDRADTTKPPRKSVTAEFAPDNVHRDGARMIAAGGRADEPSCGGPRRPINGVVPSCPRGYMVAEYDPVAMTFRTMAYGEPTANYPIAAAVVIGDELWLSSFNSNRIAYRKLPVPADPVLRVGNGQ